MLIKDFLVLHFISLMMILAANRCTQFVEMDLNAERSIFSGPENISRKVYNNF